MIRITNVETAKAYLTSQGIGLGHLKTTDCGEYFIERIVCKRCGGLGYYPTKQHGNCFECMGINSWYNTKTHFIDYARRIKKQRAAEARRAKRQEAKSEAMLEGQRAWCEANGHGWITFAELDAKRAAERKADALANPGKFLGEIGEKIEVAGEVVCAKIIDGMYGDSVLLIVKTDDGDLVKMFTASKWVWDIEKGNRVGLKGTVKSHETYNDKNSTLIKRPSLKNKETK